MSGGQQQHHGVALRDSDIADGHVIARDPAYQLHRRVITQRLLDDRRGAAGVLSECRPVLRMTQHRQYRVGDQVHRRLVAGDEQQIAGGDDFILGELIAGLLDRDQPRHQILAGMRPALSQQVAQISAQPQAGFHPLLEPLGLTSERDERVQTLRQQSRGPAELSLVLDRHPEQSADHRDRQWIGKIADHLQPARVGDLIQQSIDERGDVGLEAPNDSGRERFTDKFAQPGVVRRIQEQKAGGAERPRLLAGGDGPLSDRRLQPVTARRGMPQHLVAVDETGEHAQV